MILDALRTIRLPAEGGYGEVVVAPIPVKEDGTWGILEPLRATEWGKLLAVVSGEVMAEARHGRLKPLMQTIGRPPHALLRLVPLPERLCRQQKACGSYRLKDCHPCTSVPDCYEPPNLDPAATEAARIVALTWRDGAYVLLVQGDEFVT